MWIKPTDALNSNFIGNTALRVSDSLSAHHQEFLAVHRFWYILCICDDRVLTGVGWNTHPTLGSTRSSQYQSRCTAKISWWWAERLPETRRVVIPIKLEFSASVGFIHKVCIIFIFISNVPRVPLFSYVILHLQPFVENNNNLTVHVLFAIIYYCL